MNLSVEFRERHAAVGQFLVGEFDNLTDAINAAWLIDHLTNGSHGFVHATQIRIDSPDGSIYRLALTGQEALQPAFTSTEGIGFILGVNRIGDRQLWLIDTDRLARNGTNGMLRLSPDAGTLESLFTNLTARTLSLNAGGGVVAHGGALTERLRTTPMGEWITVAFVAGSFTASAGAWTVIAANQITFAYTLVGKTITVAFRFDSTNVTAAPLQLLVAIPGGFVAAKAMNTIFQAGDAGVFAAGNVFVTAGGTTISFQSNAGGAGWTLTAGSNTFVRGMITFEIQ